MSQTAPPSEEQQKSLALDAILQAWDAALQLGVDPTYLASAAIFAALTDMVDLHGEEAVAGFAEMLSARIRAGEFTLARAPD
jgi:hypothetical protein